ncbi:MAG: hypothetical protein H7A35_16545 [Planctomycetales bacterium]|nr:hypothetical protein [bacterium]UNM08436.1 MAG: hypothetical protein H7A35_16545 [Planctomycetales bacterium]
MSYQRGIALAVLLALSVLLCSAGEKPPAEFISSGTFNGGTSRGGMLLEGVRFGRQGNATRMVLDLAKSDGSAADKHPVYSVEYREFPYRLVIRLEGVSFSDKTKVQSSPALPFSVVTPPDGSIKELQVFLSGPSEFKVIEIDDPAKLSIDVRPLKSDIPNIYSVQLTGPANAAEAYALIEQGSFPDGFLPDAVVMGNVVVVEQTFTSASEAARMDRMLQEMGYTCIINERRGNELPQV